LKQIRLYLFLTFFFVGFTYNLIGQSVANFTFTREEGLVSNTIYDIYQAKNGFIWVATQNGVARFNGYSFKTYSFDNVKSRSVGNIIEDNTGRIWLKSFFGDIFYIENDLIKLFKPWKNENQKGFPTINQFGDTLAVASQQAYFLYNINSDKIIKKYDQQKIFSPDGWYTSNEKNKFYIKNILQPAVSYKYKHSISGLNKPDVKNKNWFLGTESRKLYEANHLTSELKDISNNYLNQLKDCRSMKEVEPGIIAFIGTNGLHLLNLTDNSTKHLLKGKNISSICAIKEGGYMVGTLNEGMIYIPSIESYILAGQFLEIQVIKEEPLEIVLGDFFGNISFLDKNLEIKKKIESNFPREVQSLYYDSLEEEIAYYTNNLHLLNSQEIIPFDTVIAKPAKDILKLNNLYYIAATGGFQIRSDSHSIIYLSKLRCTSLAYSENRNKIWIGSQQGIFEYSIDTKQPPKALDFVSSSDDIGISALIADENYLYIGTPSKGLFIYDLNSKKLLKTLDKSNGLLSNDINTIQLFDSTIWVGTDLGLSAYKYPTNRIKHIDQTKGLIAQEIHDLWLNDKTLLIIHDKGIQKLSKNIKSNNLKPQLYIDRILIDNSFYNNLDHKNGIKLLPDQHQLSIKLDVSNNIKALGNTKLIYRIKELNHSKWNKTTLKNPTANYLGLGPGNYIFEAYAENEDKVRSSILSFPIQVIAPFYQKSWFIISMTIGIFILVSIFIYLRVSHNAKKKETALLLKSQEQELQLSQLTAIRSQMNPHFIFNTMSLIQGKVINGLPQMAEKIIQDFSLLMRKILEFSQEETITIASEIEIINRYLAIEKERSQGALEYIVDVDESISAEMHKIPSLITQPFIENAIKHGLMHKKGEKKLMVKFLTKQDSLIITIEDNGIGRVAAQKIAKKRSSKHKSFAINSYKKRFNLFNSLRHEYINFEIIDLKNDKNIPSGTRVTITIDYETR